MWGTNEFNKFLTLLEGKKIWTMLEVHVEARGKEAQGFSTIVGWDNIKQNPPSNLKFPPLAMIPHKSRKYRAILDL